MATDGTGPLWPNEDALPLGTRLGEFELRRRVGEGGFSIVYLAWDHSLEREVALKEYMPASLAARVGGTTVRPRSEGTRETFEAGLRSFINEARALAQFDHPALVKVHRFWEANGTAYMVMPFYEGRTLKQTVRAMPERPDEAWLLQLLGPLTEALMVIHAANWYHRDIAPDNIVMLARTGLPLLLDFGAARRVIGESPKALTAILKPGYAPVEQYAEEPGMKQGAWTDVYALAAVVYWMIAGRTPPTSVARMLSDSFEPLATLAAGRYSERFLRATDHALAVRPEHRIRSVEDFRRAIGLAATPRRPVDETTMRRPQSSAGEPPPGATAPASTDDEMVTVARGPTPPRASAAVPSAPDFITPAAAPAAAPAPQPAPQPATATATASATAPATARVPAATTAVAAAAATVADRAAAADPAPSRRTWIVAGLGASIALIAAGAWTLRRGPGSVEPVAEVPKKLALPVTSPPVDSTSTPAVGTPEPSPTSSPVPAAVAPPNAAPVGPPVSPPVSAPVSPPVAPPAPSPAAAPDRVAPPAPDATTASPTPSAKTRRAEPSPAPTGRPPPAVAPAPPTPRDSSDAASARERERECAALLQRLSLGEASPELLGRLAALRCR